MKIWSFDGVCCIYVQKWSQGIRNIHYAAKFNEQYVFSTSFPLGMKWYSVWEANIKLVYRSRSMVSAKSLSSFFKIAVKNHQHVYQSSPEKLLINPIYIWDLLEGIGLCNYGGWQVPRSAGSSLETHPKKINHIHAFKKFTPPFSQYC